MTGRFTINYIDILTVTACFTGQRLSQLFHPPGFSLVVLWRRLQQLSYGAVRPLVLERIKQAFHPLGEV